MKQLLGSKSMIPSLLLCCVNTLCRSFFGFFVADIDQLNG